MIQTDEDIKQLYATLPRFSIDEGEAQLKTAFVAQDKLSRQDEREKMRGWMNAACVSQYHLAIGSSRFLCGACMGAIALHPDDPMPWSGDE